MLDRWDPFRERGSRMSAIDRWLNQSMDWPGEGMQERMGASLSVPMDIYETDDHLIISAEAPGLKPEDVNIQITGNRLTMQGEFHAEEESKKGNVHFQERHYGSFQRSISLPSNVNPDQAEASFDNGILKVMIPKKEEVKPKQIQVKTSSK